MALDAGHSRVRRILVGGKFGVHDRVAKLSAKTDRFHVMVAAVAEQGENEEVDTGEEYANKNELAQAVEAGGVSEMP